MNGNQGLWAGGLGSKGTKGEKVGWEEPPTGPVLEKKNNKINKIDEENEVVIDGRIGTAMPWHRIQS